MDPAVIQQHLFLAEQHAVEGKRHLARQEELIAELEQRKRDTTDAGKVLAALKETQAIREQDVVRLRAELRAASQP
jgi:hypothetical protein